MPAEYFTWSPIDVDRLREMLTKVLESRHTAFFCRDDVGGDDADDRVATAIFRGDLRNQVTRWCDYFEVESLPTARFDQSVPVSFNRPQSWTLHVDTDAIADAITTPLVAARSESRIWRPKVLERANDELMKWLRGHPNDVDRLHHRTFEAIVAEIMRDKGWEVQLTKQTRDGGVDILCLRTDAPGFATKLIVECKLYGFARSIGLPMVDRLVGVASRERADLALLVTNSRFSQDVWRRWEDRIERDLNLIDRAELLEWLRNYDGGLGAT